jgi:soluble lytic murein transglycosylase-like protein
MKYKELIEQKAEEHGIPSDLLKALIETESSFNTYAIRYEKGYPYLVEPFDQFHFHTNTEKVSQQISWGLMQILGSVARERGFEGRFNSELMEPEVGLEYGCRHLKYYYNRYNNWNDAVSAYNQGSNRKDDEGNYQNQSYVNKIIKRKKKYN